MGKVIAVCTSERKGIQKTSVPEIKVIEDWGIEGDAHAGKWHRQVSLLSFDKIEDFRARGAEVEDGAFGENRCVLAVLDHIFISIFSKIIAVCFFSMNDKDCTSDFITVL